MIKAFPLFFENSGCGYHRVKLPFQFSAEYNDYKAYLPFKAERLFEYLAMSDVVVFNRHFEIGKEEICRIKEKYGFKVVVDVDDWVVLPSYHPAYKRYKEHDAELILDNVRLADLVTVTTERLKEKFLPYNPNVEVLPNALPYGHLQFIPKEREENELFNFIYTGQSSHAEDVRLMQAAIKKANNLKCSFTIAGYVPNPENDKMLSVFKRHKNVEIIKSKALHEYMTVYDQADCSLVPLCINDFNFNKSNLKLLEAGSKKIPAIVSWVPPYRDDPDAPVLWVKRPEDWYNHMKFLSENREVAKQMGEELYQWANKKYNLIGWNKKRFGLYKSLVESEVLA